MSSSFSQDSSTAIIGIHVTIYAYDILASFQSLHVALARSRLRQHSSSTMSTPEPIGRTAPPVTYRSGMVIPNRHLIWPFPEPPKDDDEITPLPPVQEEPQPTVLKEDPEESSTQPTTSLQHATTLEQTTSHAAATRQWWRRRPSLGRLSLQSIRTRQSSSATAVESHELDVVGRQASLWKYGDETNGKNQQPTSSTAAIGTDTRWPWQLKFRAIMALISGFFQQWLSWGLVMGYGAILSYYKLLVLPKTSLPVLVIIGSIPPFLILFGALILGRFVDAGYHRSLNMIGSVLILGGRVGMMFSAHFSAEGGGGGRAWKLALAAITLGMGQCCLYSNAAHTAASWFPENRGLAIGFTSSGAAVGEFDLDILHFGTSKLMVLLLLLRWILLPLDVQNPCLHAILPVQHGNGHRTEQHSGFIHHHFRPS